MVATAQKELQSGGVKSRKLWVTLAALLFTVGGSVATAYITKDWAAVLALVAAIAPLALGYVFKQGAVDGKRLDTVLSVLNLLIANTRPGSISELPSALIEPPKTPKAN